MPYAAAPCVADAFTDTKDGRGITWGLAHFINLGGKEKFHSKLIRFDCDLSLDVSDPEMKKHHVYHSAEVYFKQGLTDKQKERITEENGALLKN